jgi:hypothetical protein
MMKKIKTRIALALLLGLVCAAPSYAKVKSRFITVGQDFAVGGTAVKAGTYRFGFDDQTNELTITDKKTKQVIAKVEAHAEARSDGSLSINVQLNNNGGAQSLASVAFDGEKQAYAVTGNTAAR